MVQTVIERVNKLTNRIENQQLKLLDELNFKLDQNYNNFVTKREKIIDEAKQKVIESCRVTRKIAGNIEKCTIEKDRRTELRQNKFPQMKLTKIDPKTFLPEFIRSGRFDFVNHFLEAKWGSTYRGDRFKNVWKFEDYRYVPTAFEPLVDEMFTFEDEKILVTCDGPGGRAFFDKNIQWFTLGEVYFTRENLRKFLRYMHNKLPKLR